MVYWVKKDHSLCLMCKQYALRICLKLYKEEQLTIKLKNSGSVLYLIPLLFIIAEINTIDFYVVVIPIGLLTSNLFYLCTLWQTKGKWWTQ